MRLICKRFRQGLNRVIDFEGRDIEEKYCEYNDEAIKVNTQLSNIGEADVMKNLISSNIFCL